MVQNVYDPLTEYENVFRERFKEVAERTFAQLAKEANVDVEANKQTCKQLYQIQASLASVEGRITRWKWLNALLWIVVIGAVVIVMCCYKQMTVENYCEAGGAALAALLFFFLKVRPRLNKLGGERDILSQKVDELQREAWKQMEPLNKLYDWDVLTRMMSETVPRLEFDPYFTTQRLVDLCYTYGWDDTFNKERSVIYSHSGLINGNPFVICRTRRMKMGERTYTGSKTIFWTTRERGADGKMHTVSHSEILYASVTAPYPEYYEKTRLIYGNTAASDLVFYRKQSGLATQEGSLSYRWKKRSLKKKARDLRNSDYAMMTNEDFEVSFNTSNRNNNQQFALLFTPLAQESMLKLLKDQTVGYGDDFDFVKNKMINTIIPDHLQEISLDLSPGLYRSLDFEKAQADFYNLNAKMFRAIYFAFAPLLCVPMYQQIRSHEDIYGRDMARHSTFWEHEALANFWGQDRFKAPNCVTNCILKTSQIKHGDNDSSIIVTAHGYSVEKRVTYVNRRGGDGRTHSIPVHWDQYLPVTGSGVIEMHEDNDTSHDAPSVTQSDRLNHISSVLEKSHLNIYRRHIASKVL